MKQLDFRDKKVLVRVDFNVPLNVEKVITDDTRIRSAIPTIEYIVEQRGIPILLSHLGRPQKKKKENGSLDIDKFSLKPIADHLAKLIDRKITFIRNTSGSEFVESIQNLTQGDIGLVENTRFEIGEGQGDSNLAEQWASVGDIFINDAFGTAHRNHASNAGIANCFDKADKSFGLLIQKELNAAEKILNDPAKPLTAILGGAKVSDKISLIEHLLDKANYIIVGGGMAYTFMKALGGKIGNSLCEDEKIDLAKSLIDKATEKGVEIILPQDSICADKFALDAKTQVCSSMEIPDGWMGLDIGPKSIRDFQEVILASKTICWNGPMGVFELAPFAEGTKQVAELLAEATKSDAFTLVGGGDSVAAVTQMQLADKVSYVSTGGGAMLTLLEGGEMPGINSIL